MQRANFITPSVPLFSPISQVSWKLGVVIACVFYRSPTLSYWSVLEGQACQNMFHSHAVSFGNMSYIRSSHCTCLVVTWQVHYAHSLWYGQGVSLKYGESGWYERVLGNFFMLLCHGCYSTAVLKRRVLLSETQPVCKWWIQISGTKSLSLSKSTHQKSGHSSWDITLCWPFNRKLNNNKKNPSSCSLPTGWLNRKIFLCMGEAFQTLANF